MSEPQPNLGTEGAADEIPSDVLTEDALWIKNAAQLPRARLLMEHLSALEAMVCCGGIKGLEPPIEQAATFRRAFCYEYAHSNRPFGIGAAAPVPGGNTLPKCVGILNLSGRHAIYHSESATFAKVVCLSSQPVNSSIVDGVNAVVDKAKELDATVLLTFCLPFQAGLERAYWEVRTIRKTSRGSIKDGELCFGTGDGMPRVVPCTRSLEHWTDAVIVEISRKLASTATAVSLDKEDEDDGRKLSYSGLESIVEMLKADRKKLMESHKAELSAVHDKHKGEMDGMQARVEAAEKDANSRIAKVAHASKSVEDSMKKKEDQLTSHNITLREQVASLQRTKDKAVSDLKAATLQHEEECVKAAARQKTLEAQSMSINGKLTRCTAEWAKQRKELETEKDNLAKNFVTKISQLQNALATKDVAIKAIEAGAKEARDMMKTYEENTSRSVSDIKRVKAEKRVYKAMLALAALSVRRRDDLHTTELQNIRAKAEREKRMNKAKMKEMDDERAKESLAHLTELTAVRVALKAAECECENAKKSKACDSNAQKPPVEEVDKDATNELQKKLKESEQELSRKKHLLTETEKRVKYLETTLKESDNEAWRLKKELETLTSATGTNTPASDENAPDRGGTKSRTVTKEGDVSVNVNQNTAVFMQSASPHAHTQAFPTTNYVVDPNLENTISSLHSALSFITSLARSSSTHSKNAELAHAKLDALASVGLAHHNQQPMFFDPPPTPQQFHHPASVTHYQQHPQHPRHHPRY